MNEDNFAAMCSAFERLLETEASRTPLHDPVCFAARMALRELRKDYAQSADLRCALDRLTAERGKLAAELAAIKAQKPVRGAVLQDGQVTLVQLGTESLRVHHCGAQRLYTRP